MRRLSTIFASAVLAVTSTAASAAGPGPHTPDEVREMLEQRDERIVVFYNQGLPCPQERKVDVCAVTEAVIAFSADEHTMSVWRGNERKDNEARELGAASGEYRLTLEIEQAEVNNFARSRAFGSDHPFVARHDFSKEAGRAGCADVPERGLVVGPDECGAYSEIMNNLRARGQVMFRGLIAESNREAADFEEGNLIDYTMVEDEESGRAVMLSGLTLPNGAMATLEASLDLQFTEYGGSLARAREPMRLAYE
jgi:hypothetical protein